MLAFDARMSGFWRACMKRLLKQELCFAGSPARMQSAMELSVKNSNGCMSKEATVGDWVSVCSLEDEQIMEFLLAKPFTKSADGKALSVLSPLGSSLVGKKEGDVVNVRFLGYKTRFLLLKIAS